jgi:hypothetical protein
MTLTRSACLAILCAMFGMAAGGCSTQARRVNCEGRLEPINRPASAQEQPATKPRERAPR